MVDEATHDAHCCMEITVITHQGSLISSENVILLVPIRQTTQGSQHHRITEVGKSHTKHKGIETCSQHLKLLAKCLFVGGEKFLLLCLAHDKLDRIALSLQQSVIERQ